MSNNGINITKETSVRAGGYDPLQISAGIALLAILLVNWIATQWVADSFAYQPQLGTGTADIGNLRLYFPGTHWIWFFKYRGSPVTATIVTQGVTWTIAWMLIAFSAVFALATFRSRKVSSKKTLDAFSSTWADEVDVRYSGLLATTAQATQQELETGKADPGLVMKSLPTAADRREFAELVADRKAQLATKGLSLLDPQAPGGAKKPSLLAKGQGVYIGGWFDPRAIRHAANSKAWWASALEQLGLRKLDKGAVVALMDNQDTHGMVVAPTRGGKGVVIVMPTMLSWTGSVFAYDTKGELWAKSSGFRKSMGHKVLRLAVWDPEGSARYNPLDAVRIGTPFEVQDAQNIAEILKDPAGSGKSGGEIWDTAMSDALMGLILYVLNSPCVPNSKRNIAGILEIVSDAQRSGAEGAITGGSGNDDGAAMKRPFLDMLKNSHVRADILNKLGLTNFYWQKLDSKTGQYHTLHPTISQCIGRLVGIPEKTMGSVLFTLVTNLALYADPIIAANTSCSDFLPEDLMESDIPVSLYLVHPAEQEDRLRPFTRLLVTQCVNQLMKVMEFGADNSETPSFKYRLLWMLDEFASLGNIKAMPTAFTKAAGYGHKFIIILQTEDSLKTSYDKAAGVIASNCSTKVMFSPNDLDSAEKIEKMAGKTKGHAIETSVSGKGSDSSTSTSLKEETVDLLANAEARQMHRDEMLIFFQGMRPIRGRKFYYYKNPELLRRSQIPPPKVSDTLRDPGVLSDVPMEKPTVLENPVALSKQALASLPQVDEAKLVAMSLVSDDVLDTPQEDPQNPLPKRRPNARPPVGGRRIG